jgi:hypothetical protein
MMEQWGGFPVSIIPEASRKVGTEKLLGSFGSTV